MSKKGLVLALALLAGCATAGRDVNDPVAAKSPPAIVECLAWIVYGLGQWLGPKT